MCYLISRIKSCDQSVAYFHQRTAYILIKNIRLQRLVIIHSVLGQSHKLFALCALIISVTPFSSPGNQYGTPRPPKDPQGQIPRRTSSIGSILPGAHPSSEGKRRRNRSNTDAPPKSPATPRKELPAPPPRGVSMQKSDSTSNLGPLPSNWEMAFTEDGHPYFIE